MKNWTKVDKKELEILLEKDTNLEISKTADDKYEAVYLVKIRKMSQAQKNFLDSINQKITNSIDEKFTTFTNEFDLKIQQIQLNSNINEDLENKINEFKTEFLKLKEEVKDSLSIIDSSVTSQNKINSKNFDTLIKKALKIEAKTEGLERDLSKIKDLPEIKKELNQLKKQKTKQKTLNAINESLIIKSHKNK